jgi:repressor LexA
MCPEPLTEQQETFRRQLMRFHYRHQYAPTYEEMVTVFGLSSKSHAKHFMRQLEAKGYIRIKPGSPRAIELLDRRFAVPFCGKVSAGRGISFTDADSTVEIPPDLFPPSDDLYAVEVSGDSMLDALIRDGDLLLVAKAERVENGQLAVLRFPSPAFPDGETVCKRFYHHKVLVELRSENPNYPPRYLPAEEVQVQGKVVGVIRSEVRGMLPCAG